MSNNDQAKKLRDIAAKLRMSRFDTRRDSNVKRVAITSGKGGVGKSSFSLNLGIVLSKMNKKVLLIDADINLGNIDILLGVVPGKTLRDVVNENAKLEEILIKGPEGLTILPASSGDLELLKKGESVRETIEKQLTELELKFEFILVDTGAGIGSDVIDFALNSDEIIVITTTEPTAFTDAYAVVKTITSEKERSDISIMVNLVTDEKEAKEVYDRISMVSSHFLQKDVRFCGFMRRDGNVLNAIRNQTPFFIQNDRTPASRDIWNIAIEMIKRYKTLKKDNNSESMFGKILK
ncbi:MAG: MinD/ParA family protein [Candidatus Delongbacteria bacterium]|nr:MinD/ParA family protein [Candidatus Delongbacteria bacterium]MBN2834890.1 MinD/ParA family protein [Candidatus Delongbacteria bacterium]